MPDPSNPLADLAAAVGLLAEVVHAQAHPGCASRDVGPGDCASGDATYRLIAERLEAAKDPAALRRRWWHRRRLEGRLEVSPYD